MSVWRIKDVDEATRNQAQQAATQAGMPLGTWLERLVMARIQGTRPPAAAAPAVQPPGPPADQRTSKRKQRNAKRNRPASSEQGNAPAANPAHHADGADGASSVTRTEPVLVAKASGRTAQPAASNDAIASAPPPAGPNDDIVPHPFDPPAPSPFGMGDAEVAQASPTPILPSGAADPIPLHVTPREKLNAPPPAARRSYRLSPLPVIGVGGLIAIIAVGIYFMLSGRNDETSPPPSVAAVAPAPAPAPVAAPAANPPAPPATSAAPAAPAMPAPAAAPTPSPPPSTAAAPAVPAPRKGVQPSLLTPIPDSPDPAPAAVDPAPPPIGPTPGSFTPRLGPVAVDKDSLTGLIGRAGQGDVDAQIELGKRYLQGIGTTQNPAEALRWLEQAANAGNPQAQFNTGVMYERGLGTAPDLAKAVGWYRKAAAAAIPVPMALHNLALLYVTGGGGIAPDPVQARILMTRAAEMDIPESQYSLALMHFHGVGGAPDKVTALSWLRLAARRTNNAEWIQALQQLANGMNATELARAHDLSNQHVKRINDTLVALRGGPDSKPAGGNAPLDRAGIAELQRLLAGLKLYAGTADGAMGPKTEQAIRDYQAIAGVTVDGRATVELLNGLREVAGAVKPK